MTGPAQGALNHLAWHQEPFKNALLRDLDSLANTIENIRSAIQMDNMDEIKWLADHSQGITFAATKVERGLTKIQTLILAMDTVANYAATENQS